jgi:hypothetical protein
MKTIANRNDDMEKELESARATRQMLEKYKSEYFIDKLN